MTPPLNTRFSAELRKGSAKRLPQFARRRETGAICGIALRVCAARTFRRPSLEWAQQTKDGADLAAQRQLADVIALGGGVPINVGNDTIGAVGVSGSSQTGDEACAKAGVAKVAEQLKTN